MSTAYHAKYFAHELTKRCPSDSIGKLAASLANAQVDLNPHQVEAALFAFRSPLSRGAILADEVGLGKTIEAGILLSQKWAERRRRLLVITPANLRKQWSQELADKFFLPTLILEIRSFNEQIKGRNLNPFDQPANIVLCSYQFARTKEPYLRQVPWDLVVIDEAHRLRNVYKPNSRIANAIKDALAPYHKVLLTATPLQNSLLELYGLVSIIDEFTFGDLKSFKAQFARSGGEGNFTELKERLKPVCQRTLRRQVLEYIRYTNRIPITQEFYPSEDEQRLYDLVTEYLQSPSLYALPSGQRKLMTLILRKLLASSTFAISGTLAGLAQKLEETAHKQEDRQENVTPDTPSVVAESLESYDELADEWDEDDEGHRDGKDRRFTPVELAEMREEVVKLQEFAALARSIVRNSKGEVLLTALKRGLAQARAAGGGEKAIIFTESVRTQEYLRSLLEQTEFAGRLVLFNGTNNDSQSREIHARWLERHAGTDRVTGSPTADKRAALVDYFRDEAAIMIATEAAAEGINLQFCSLVVNYDLPWNPQRIEQRIGRCHRYGQRFDVVVVNFLNKANAADQRVYQLLSEKFQLFSGVFGASDEVLGTVESGVDFERRIEDIFQRCRTEKQIEFEFDTLQGEMETQIDERMRATRQTLLENFDEEVHEKLRLNLKESSDYLDKFDSWLWQLTRFCLADHAHFEKDRHAFTLLDNPFPDETIHPGPYRAGRDAHPADDEANRYRIGHPLAQRLIDRCKALPMQTGALVFRLTGCGKKISALEPFVGQSGWLAATLLSITAADAEEHIILAAFTDDGAALPDDTAQRLFSLDASEAPIALDAAPPPTLRAGLDAALETRTALILETLNARNGAYFEAELNKLDHWAGDLKEALEQELKEIDRSIKDCRREAQLAGSLDAKLALHRRIKELESRRASQRRDLFKAQDEIDARKERLLSEVEGKLRQKLAVEPLFLVRWTLA